METTTSATANIEKVTISDVLSLATWDRPRTDVELDDFISRRELAVRRQLF